MLRDLDETIKQLLIKAGGFVPSDVDISFNIPNREWSEKLGARPALNCYLFDIHERRALREEGWRVDGRGPHAAKRRQPPLFFEATYLITAWTRVVEDEHLLLWRALETLVRFPTLNDASVLLYQDADEDVRENKWLEQEVAQAAMAEQPRLIDCLSGKLVDYPWPITAQVAQMEGVLKSPGEFWTALENHLKPSLSYVVTLGLDRQAMRVGKPVLASGINIRLPEVHPGQALYIQQLFHLPPGMTPGAIPIEVEGAGLKMKTKADGTFSLGELKPGRYVIIAQIGDRARQQVLVIRDPAARPEPNRFSDVLRDQHGPIAGATITVEGYDQTTVTDAKGRFTLELPPGQYTLLVDISGWIVRHDIMVADSRYRVRFRYGGIPGADRRS